MGEKLSNPEWLREKYHHEGLTLKEVANICNVTPQAVHYRMDKYDIERRDSVSGIASYTTRPDGYTEIRGSPGERCYHHRLLATLLVDDISEMKDCDVHHKQDAPGVKPDFLDNLEILTRREHQETHGMDHSEIGKKAWNDA